MSTTPNKSAARPAPSQPPNAQPPDIASASVPDTLAALHVNSDTGLTRAEVDVRLKEHGHNEVAETRGQAIQLTIFQGVRLVEAARRLKLSRFSMSRRLQAYYDQVRQGC